METTTYSSNNNNALLKDNGPFRLTSADSSLKGHTVYQYRTQYSPTIVGKHAITVGIKGKTKTDLIKLR